MDPVDRSRTRGLWHPQPQADEGLACLQKDRNLRACQLLLGHRKLESTVRYLGIEVDDALELLEQIDL